MLLSDSNTSTSSGFGPLPGGLAVDIIDASQGRKMWRTVRTGGRAADGAITETDSEEMA